MMSRIRPAIYGGLAALIIAIGASEFRQLPRLSCTRDAEQPVPGLIRAGRIFWVDRQGREHLISGTADEWRWSCLPADGRTYPEDTR